MKALQTRYAGFRFRSRLEARWAVFLTHAEIPWRYEAEGYALDSGECYLPDFYLPAQDAYAEVKGGDAALAEDLPRMTALATESGRYVFILGDVPDQSHTLCYPPVHAAITPTGSVMASLVAGAVGYGGPGAFLATHMPMEATTEVRFLAGLYAGTSIKLAYGFAREARFMHGAAHVDGGVVD